MADVCLLISFGSLVAAITVPLQVGSFLGLL